MRVCFGTEPGYNTNEYVKSFAYIPEYIPVHINTRDCISMTHGTSLYENEMNEF